MFRVLGPVEVDDPAGRPIQLRRRRERAVLALLSIEVGALLPTDRLADILWDGEPPAGARRQLSANVSRLRAALAGLDAEIVGGPAGYRLRADPEAVDAHRFRSAVHRARAVDDPAGRIALLGPALALWRGPVAAGAIDDSVRRRLARDLVELRDSARDLFFDSHLRAGTGERVLGELLAFAEARPARETTQTLAMWGLAQAGRTGDALAHFRAHRRYTSSHLGREPGATVQEMHRALLRGAPPVASPAPRELPRAVGGFVGRAAELATLDGAGDGAAPLFLVTGPAGVGKTALAVTWAHRRADRFPDGQLYADLAGSAPGDPARPLDVLARFLRALDPDRPPPTGLDEAAARFRSLLAGRRVLVLLDDARDEEQVRPLLSAAPGSTVVVTGRTRLLGLAIAEGAHAVPLDVLPRPDATALLREKIGPHRVAGASDAVTGIAESCGGLPLALAIAGARAGLRPDDSLAALVVDLDTLAGDDPATDPRTVFSWSYRQLTPPAATLFRRLGVHPGPTFAPDAADALLGAPAGAALRELLGAHLVGDPGDGRHGLHGLLRGYAADRLDTDEGPAGRRAATRSLLDHYVTAATAADRALFPGRTPIAAGPDEPGPPPPGDPAVARAWFAAEHPTLLAAVRLAHRTGHDRPAWRLAYALCTYLNRGGHWSDWKTVMGLAVDAAARSADPVGLAHSYRNLSAAETRLGEWLPAAEHLATAIQLFATRPGSEAHLASARFAAAWLAERMNDVPAALRESEAGLAAARRGNDRHLVASGLNNVGWYHSLLGDHATALPLCRQALTLMRELGNRHGEAYVWESLGHAQQGLGDPAGADASYRAGLALAREVGERNLEAGLLTRRGEVAAADEAADLLDAAARIYDEIAPEQAARIRAGRLLRTVHAD